MAAPTVSRNDFSFFHSLRVRWSEVDPQGIVFNGSYLTYADVATTEYYRHLGVSYPADLLRDRQPVGQIVQPVRDAAGGQFRAALTMPGKAQRQQVRGQDP